MSVEKCETVDIPGFSENNPIKNNRLKIKKSRGTSKFVQCALCTNPFHLIKEDIRMAEERN